jgi:peptidylprolyl isomerase
MARLGPIGLVLISLSVTACGASSEATPPVRKVVGTPAPPPIHVPSGPPPDQVVIKELRRGAGVQLKEGDGFAMNYAAVKYGNGEKTEAHWEKHGGFSWQYGKGKLVKAMVIGLKGMRVGGRRELIVPSRFAYHNGPLVYVVELVEVE